MFTLFTCRQSAKLEYQNDVDLLALQTGFDVEVVDRWCRELAQTSILPLSEAPYRLQSLWALSDECLLLEGIHPGFGALMEGFIRIKPLDILGLEFIPPID